MTQPEYTYNIGDMTLIKNIHDEKIKIKILDEILIPVSGSNEKLLCFQKVLFIEENIIELRLAYYMIGVRGRTKGKWVWGQYAAFVNVEDMVKLISMAKRKKWFEGISLNSIILKEKFTIAVMRLTNFVSPSCSYEWGRAQRSVRPRAFFARGIVRKITRTVTRLSKPLLPNVHRDFGIPIHLGVWFMYSLYATPNLSRHLRSSIPAW